MKHILFGNTKGSSPFWMPWGIWGFIWRTFVFLVLLFILITLLSLFKDHTGINAAMANFQRPDPIYQRPDTLYVPDYGSDPEWGRPLDDGPEYGLPPEEENIIPPFNPDDVIADPDNGQPTPQLTNQLYVVFNNPDYTDDIFREFATAFYAQYPQPEHSIQYYNTDTKTALLVVPAESRLQILDEIHGRIPQIDFYIVPVEVFRQGLTTNDPIFQYPELGWYFDPIQAREAWEITQGSPEVIIGIVDSYFDLTHEELASDRIIFPFSVPKRNTDVAPESGVEIDAAGHGSLVASVALGNADNGVGSTGIAPKCKFIPVSQSVNMTTVTMLEGILYCMYHGATVINVSCGTYFPDEVLQWPVEQQIAYTQSEATESEDLWGYIYDMAAERNVTIVWAAGNQNLYDAMDSSKRNANTIRVSAVDRDLKKADFSNFGNFEEYGIQDSDISAPGVDIFGALPNNSYDYWPGTSFSAPIVTGAVALMKSINPNLTTPEIIDILQVTGKPINDNPEIGKLIQIKDALLEVQRRMNR